MPGIPQIQRLKTSHAGKRKTSPAAAARGPGRRAELAVPLRPGSTGESGAAKLRGSLRRGGGGPAGSPLGGRDDFGDRRWGRGGF